MPIKRSLTKIKNTEKIPKKIVIVTREMVTIQPGEEIEIDGDIELIENSRR